MKLRCLLNQIAHIDADIDIKGLCLDSRRVKTGDAFIALNGALQHGMKFADQAIANGAVVVIYDPAGLDSAEQVKAGVVYVAIPDLSRHLGEIAARFYGHPSKHIDVIGVTGTNGKTTCSQLLAQALPDCGIIGTLGWGEPGQLIDTGNTTPDALAVQQILNALSGKKKRFVAMEVSSHGLEQGRVNAVDFKGALFTNLSRDHLDYHGDMQAYLRAKLGLFKNPALEFAIVNLDDTNSDEVLNVLHRKVRRWGFSCNARHVDGVECLSTDNVQYHAGGIEFAVHWGKHSLRASTPVVGAFNLQNVMAILCTLLAMAWPFEKAVAQLAKLRPVVGRMEKFGGNGKPCVIVDYAHTPDALEKVLQTIKGQGRLWTIFGCGGDRDKGKRPQMGRIAEIYADRVILTDDNPRTEASDAIIKDILAGCQTDKIHIINDRRQAITTVIQQAASEDFIVIAGKGHENYQEIDGKKIPFSDQQVTQEALAAWRVTP